MAAQSEFWKIILNIARFVLFGLESNFVGVSRIILKIDPSPTPSSIGMDIFVLLFLLLLLLLPQNRREIAFYIIKKLKP